MADTVISLPRTRSDAERLLSRFLDSDAGKQLAKQEQEKLDQRRRQLAQQRQKVEAAKAKAIEKAHKEQSKAAAEFEEARKRFEEARKAAVQADAAVVSERGQHDKQIADIDAELADTAPAAIDHFVAELNALEERLTEKGLGLPTADTTMTIRNDLSRPDAVQLVRQVRDEAEGVKLEGLSRWGGRPLRRHRCAMMGAS